MLADITAQAVAGAPGAQPAKQQRPMLRAVSAGNVRKRGSLLALPAGGGVGEGRLEVQSSDPHTGVRAFVVLGGFPPLELGGGGALLELLSH